MKTNSGLEKRIIQLEAEVEAVRAALKSLADEICFAQGKTADLAEMVQAEGELASRLLAVVERRKLKIENLH